MDGGGGSPTTQSLEAETNNNTLLPPKFVSAFTLCEGCNQKLSVVRIPTHNCNLVRANLAKKKLVEKKKKSKRPPPPTAFYIFMNDFRKTYEYKNPSVNVKDVAKLGGETWKSFTEDEKKVYRDKAARLMEEYNNSIESNDADDEDEEKDTDEAE